MEPNYANYSYNELLEVLETIDHHAYPERVDSIKARLATLTQNSTSASIRGDYKDISLILFLFSSVIGAVCAWMLFKESEDDFRHIVGALLLPASPFYIGITRKSGKFTLRITSY